MASGIAQERRRGAVSTAAKPPEAEVVTSEMCSRTLFRSRARSRVEA